MGRDVEHEDDMARVRMEKGERAEPQTTFVIGRQRVARRRMRCATCGGDIASGEGYRADEWRPPLGGEVLTSRICWACQREGL